MSAILAPTSHVVERMPFEDYVHLRDVHATGLKNMLTSALLYRRREDAPRPDKDALRLGRACHTSTLEPDQFALEFAVWRKKEGRRGTKKHKEWSAVNAGRTLLTEDQYTTALRIRDAVRAHPEASALLSTGRPEVSFRWKHERTGLPCKARIDWLNDAVVDLKTTRNPAPWKFATDAAKFGYALQIAFYVDAVLAVTGKLLRPVIIAAQNVEPYDVVVFDVPDAVFLHGREQYEKAIDKVAECTKSGKWPGLVPEGTAELHLPSWAMSEEDGPDESLPIEEVSF